MNSRQPPRDRKRHNVRVYGLLAQQGRLLLVDEQVKEQSVTKFPGGGLEWGEGTRTCLVREFKEETGIDIQVGEHLYTTDFFQQSAFTADDQIISIYYQVTADSAGLDRPIRVMTRQLHLEEQILGFRWIELSRLKVDDVSLPIDQYVVRQILDSKLTLRF